MQFSFSPFSTLRWSQKEDIDCCVSLGLDGIGLWRPKIDDLANLSDENSADYLVDLMTEANVAVSSLHHCGGFTGNWGLTFQEAVDDVHEAIKLAQRLQAGCLLVHPGGGWIHTHGQQKRILQDALNQIVPIASDYGVRLTIEPRRVMRDSKWTMIKTIESALDVVSLYSPEQMGITLDLFEFGCNRLVMNNLSAWRDRIALIQMCDTHAKSGSIYKSGESSRCLMGDGQVPLRDWFNALTQIEYDGFVEFEIYGHAVEALDYQQIIEHSQQKALALNQSSSSCELKSVV